MKGYNRRNFLLRVEQVNEIYKNLSRRGIPLETIYREHVKDKFLMSRSSFYNYLSIPYERQLAELERKLSA
jgi:hypothetical protein